MDPVTVVLGFVGIALVLGALARYDQIFSEPRPTSADEPVVDTDNSSSPTNMLTAQQDR
jgi:hypothetical protein